MTAPKKPAGDRPQASEAAGQSPVIDPINIARARYASAHGQSVVDKTRRMSTPVPAGRPAQAGQPAAKADTPAWGGMNGCLLVALLGIVFLTGGVLGGMVGGGLLLWAGSSNGGLALWQDPPTPTPLPTPTPAPAATATPTPTPEPVVTPSVEDLIDQLIPSVVTVINHQNTAAFAFSPEEDRVVGSGVIVDRQGYIATNNHVVENAAELSVVLYDGREIIAQLVAADPAEDLAILKVALEDLPAIHWGDSNTVRLGQEVYAIGSPLGDFPNSVSFGIVSGLNRALEMDEFVIDGLIQTDAAINRGSSGGPLINTHGEVVGLNTFIIRESEDRGIAEGIAFAIPSNTAKSLLDPWMAAHRGGTVPIPASGEPGN